jgi:hypothetical protein
MTQRSPMSDQVKWAKIITEKEALQFLARGESVSNTLLAKLSRNGLIEVDDVTNMESPPGDRELLFICITARGRRVLEG